MMLACDAFLVLKVRARLCELVGLSTHPLQAPMLEEKGRFGER
jgi:hypothetical protein